MPLVARLRRGWQASPAGDEDPEQCDCPSCDASILTSDEVCPACGAERYDYTPAAGPEDIEVQVAELEAEPDASAACIASPIPPRSFGTLAPPPYLANAAAMSDEPSVQPDMDAEPQPTPAQLRMVRLRQRIKGHGVDCYAGRRCPQRCLVGFSFPRHSLELQSYLLCVCVWFAALLISLP